MIKSCGNCVNCWKGEDFWSCEEYGFYYAGCPVRVDPPYDDPCPHWTDDPKKRNTWLNHV